MLDQLEKEANDDFHLLEAVGPAEFSTEHLLELHELAHVRLMDYRRRNRINIALGVLIFGWTVAFFVAYAYQNVWLAITAVFGLLVSLVACITGIYLVTRLYKSRHDLDYSLRVIESELKRR